MKTKKYPGYFGKIEEIGSYRGSPLSTIFGILKKTYYVKFVLKFVQTKLIIL